MTPDKFNTFADKVALKDFTGGAIGDVLDMKKGRRLGEGAPLYLAVQINQDFTATGDASAQFVIETSDDPEFPTTDKTEILRSQAFKKDELTAGFLWYDHAPYGAKRYARFLMNVTTGGPFACGGITAALVADADTSALR